MSWSNPGIEVEPRVLIVMFSVGIFEFKAGYAVFRVKTGSFVRREALIQPSLSLLSVGSRLSKSRGRRRLLG